MGGTREEDVRKLHRLSESESSQGQAGEEGICTLLPHGQSRERLFQKSQRPQNHIEHQ